MAPGSIERTLVQMSRPRKQDSPVVQDRRWSRECFCASYQFLCPLPSSDTLIYKEAMSLYSCTSLQRVDGTLRKLQHLLQLSATEERRKTTQKNQLVPTGQSAIKLTDLIQQIETVAPEAIYVHKTLFKQSNYLISSNLSQFCTCLTCSSAPCVKKWSTSQLNSNATI